MIEVYSNFKRINPKVIETKERKDIKTGVKFRLPYFLMLDPAKVYLVKHPKNLEKTHSIRVVERKHKISEEIFDWFGLELDPELSKRVKDKIIHNQIGDRFGVTGYCEVQIVLDRYYDLFTEDETKCHELAFKVLEDACNLYNYFLDRYSAIVRHRQLSKISHLDIHQLNLLVHLTFELVYIIYIIGHKI